MTSGPYKSDQPNKIKTINTIVYWIQRAKKLAHIFEILYYTIYCTTNGSVCTKWHFSF